MTTIQMLFGELKDGFIRSVGLGVTLSQPVSLILDKTGIYFDATAPSDLENILNNLIIDEWEIKRSRLS